MKTSAPPALATWLMTRLTCGEKSESLIGDLIEQYGHGRSTLWYWRQAITTIGASFAAETWRHMWLAAGVVVLGSYLPRIYMFIMTSWYWYLDRPYALLIDWLLKMEMDGVRHFVYRLHLQGLPGTVAYCALVAIAAWIMTALRPRQRGLVAALLFASQVGLAAPYLRTSVVDWLHEPWNPIWFFNTLWFYMFEFVAIPLSIFWGGLGGMTSRTPHTRLWA